MQRHGLLIEEELFLNWNETLEWLPWLANAQPDYHVAGRLSGLNFKFDARFSP